MKTPKELQAELISLFPSFEEGCDAVDPEYDIGYESPLTYHRIWMDFAPFASKHLTNVGERDLIEFCAIVNAEIEAGSDRKNAVSTCLLEHASQVSVKKLISPLLSAAAKKELR